MIKLTAPNGTEVEVNSLAITSIYPNDGTYDKRAKTVLIVAGQHQAVIETVAEVKALIK
jgi:uncharacterized protein YlzI (FlbEa/FlbD family)